MSWLGGNYIGFNFLCCPKCEHAKHKVYDVPGFKEHYSREHLDGFNKGSSQVCQLSFGLDGVVNKDSFLQANAENRNAQICQPKQYSYKQLQEKYAQLETALTVALVRAMQASNATTSRDKMKSLVERLRGCPEWSAVFQQPLLSSGETGQCCMGSAVDHADLGTKQPKLEPETPTSPEVGGGVEKERRLAVAEQPVTMTTEPLVETSQSAVHQEGIPMTSGTLSADLLANNVKIEEDAPEYYFVRSNEEVQYDDSHSSIPPPASPDPETSSQKSAEMESSVPSNLRPPKEEGNVAESDSESTYSIPPPASPDPEPEPTSQNSIENMETSILPADSLPFGLVAKGSSVQITNFASCSLAIKQGEVESLCLGRQFLTFVNFLDEFMTKTGLSFTIHLQEKTKAVHNPFVALISCDQLPDLAVQSMWSNKRRQKPVYTAESKIVRSLLKYIGTCTNIDRNEVVWFKLAGNKETTDIAVNYLSGLMKEAFSGKKKHREHLKRKVEQFKRSHLRDFLAQLDAVAPYVRLSLVRRRQMMDNGDQLPVSIVVVNSSMASPSGGTDTMPKSGKRTADWITTQNEPNEHVPAVKVSRLATRPLPFGMTSFCPSGNVRHRFRRLPLNEAELHVMHVNNGDLPAGIMRKQFVNRLLAKAEIDIVLEQFSETTSSSWGYTIRLEGVPDAMFCVSYAMNSTDSSHYVEDGMIQFILGRLSSRDPSFIPFMAAGAVYTNQRSADHLATYVSVALKYVRAQQGLSHEAMDKHQIAESLNDCLTEYWRVNLTALSAHLASSLHDNLIVPLPSE